MYSDECITALACTVDLCARVIGPVRVRASPGCPTFRTNPIPVLLASAFAARRNVKVAMSAQTIRVCHLGKYYPPAPGGIESHVRILARAQAELGLGVQVFCVNHRPGPTITEQDGAVEVVRFSRKASAAKMDICLDLVAALRTVKADILHLQVPNPTMIVALLAARSHTPLVVTYQSDVIRQRVLSVLFRPLERQLYRRVRMIMPSSPLYPGGSPFLRSYSDRIQVLPMGIDLQPYLDPSSEDQERAARLREQYGRAGPIWVCAGRLVYYKGLINAIRALERVPGYLLIIGDGPDETMLREEAGRLGVSDRVVFVGALPYLEIVPYYLAATAFWFPSNARSEAFGIVQVEAMASGCPVINTQIPHSGVSWVSRHEETGLTVPVDDPIALAESANRLLTEPGLRDRLAAAARERAIREFDHRTMAERSLNIYRHILAGEPEGQPAERPLLVPGSQSVVGSQ
jgi:glycosyltransferase involved in cell wall biosynthesis